jgi:hypothetical protein
MSLTNGQWSTLICVTRVEGNVAVVRHQAPNVRTTLLLTGHIQTPLFSRAPSLKVLSTPFYRFFTPSLQPHELVKAVITAMDEQESQSIMLPFYVNFVRLATTLPSYGRDFFQWVS